MKHTILLKNANVFDVGRGVFRNNLDVLVEKGIISDVGKLKQVDGKGCKQMDCKGKFVLPGLFECHAHLALLMSKDDETKEQIMENLGTTEREGLEEQVLKGFVANGITQIRDVGGPVKSLKHLKGRISDGEFLGPDIFYAGPMLEKSPLTWEEHNKAMPRFTVAVNSKEDAENIVEEVANEGASLVKTFNKFDVDVFRHLLDQAKRRNLPVTHDPGTTFFQCVPMNISIDSGIRCFEHAKAPWPIVLKSDLRLEHDSLIDADPKTKEHFVKKVCSLGAESVSLKRLHQLLDKMLREKVYFCATLHAMKYMHEKESKGQNKDMLEKLEALDQMQSFFARQMVGRNIKILVGQDGLIPQFTFDEMRYLNEVGLSESEIIKGATIYPAEWLGVADRLGSISPGKKANILILDKNPLRDIENITTTHAVLKDGKLVSR